MKRNSIFQILKYCSLVSLLYLFSCKKEYSPAYFGDIYNCCVKNALDSIQLKNALIGEWNWEYIACEVGANNTQYKGLSIHFKSDLTLDVKQNGKIVQSSKWNISKEFDNIYNMGTYPTVNQLKGRLIICDNKVIFNFSYIDGCDNYFVKKL